MRLPRSLESFGLLPFLFYTLLGFVFYLLIKYTATSTNLLNDLNVITGSWLFLSLAGLSFGIVTVTALTRFTPYSRKTWGLLIGGLVPLIDAHWGEVPLLAPLVLGLLLGLAFITRQERQLKWAKAFAPLPLFVLLIPPTSEAVLEFQKGTYTQHFGKILGYLGIIILVLVEAYFIHATARHALRDEDTSEEVTIFLGPRQSGKTILSLGFYYTLVTKRKGTHEDSFVISEEGTPLDLAELYSIFRRMGFQGVKGTQKGWLTIHTFRIKRGGGKKFLHGLKDVELEITDYAGEILWDLEEIVRDTKKYDDLVKAVEQDIEADMERFKEAIRYRKNVPDEKKDAIAEEIKRKIIHDLERMRFDFRNYRREIYWEKVPESIRDKLAVAHTLSSLMRADKVVPLLDGEGILYELYQRDREAREALNDMKNYNPTLYEVIMNAIRKFERANQALESSLQARRATLEAQLRAYDAILSRFKKRNRRGDFAFLVTKADLIGAIFMPFLLNISLSGVKKRIINLLKSTTAFLNLLQKLVPEKELKKRIILSIILSPADLKHLDPESAEDLREEVLVRGLDELVEWLRTTPIIRVLKEVLLP
ncbi:hypothetical protein [Thermococcus sp.]|uniref:hypothetical protein n=1 Tax=Thermococcus sp. TaxID=35749 RepID=UPI00263698F9|nr:hypothetical protein [Thermococcus sp.]